MKIEKEKTQEDLHDSAMNKPNHTINFLLFLAKKILLRCV